MVESSNFGLEAALRGLSRPDTSARRQFYDLSFPAVLTSDILLTDRPECSAFCPDGSRARGSRAPSFKARCRRLWVLEQVPESAVRRRANSLSQADAHQPCWSVIRRDWHIVCAPRIYRARTQQLRSRQGREGPAPAGRRLHRTRGCGNNTGPGRQCCGLRTAVCLRRRRHRLGVSRNHWRSRVPGGPDGEAAQVQSQLCPLDRRRSLGRIRVRREAPAALSRLHQHYDVRLRRSLDRLWSA